MDRAISEMRVRVAETGRMLYERFLTDAGGGNITARVKTAEGDVICMSPRYSGSRHRWKLTPDDVLVIDLDGKIIEGKGDLSRETKAHLTLHKTFGEHGTAVIHAHSRNTLVFCAMKQPMPMVLEQTVKFGTIPVVEYAPAHTQQLADGLVAAIRGNEARIRKQAAAALAPWHGVFAIGKDLDATYDAIERIDTNAYILMMANHLGSHDLLAAQRRDMETAMSKWEKNGE